MRAQKSETKGKAHKSRPGGRGESDAKKSGGKSARGQSAEVHDEEGFRERAAQIVATLTRSAGTLRAALADPANRKKLASAIRQAGKLAMKALQTTDGDKKLLADADVTAAIGDLRSAYEEAAVHLADLDDKVKRDFRRVSSALGLAEEQGETKRKDDKADRVAVMQLAQAKGIRAGLEGTDTSDSGELVWSRLQGLLMSVSGMVSNHDKALAEGRAELAAAWGDVVTRRYELAAQIMRGPKNAAALSPKELHDLKDRVERSPAPAGFGKAEHQRAAILFGIERLEAG